MSDLILDSLRRRMRAMHSLWEDAVASMTAEHVNHVERRPVLPIAFSLFHFVRIEDSTSSVLGAGAEVYDPSWSDRMELAIPDHGKERSPEEMVDQRIGNYQVFQEYMAAVFAKTESWLSDLDGGSLSDVIVARPLPEQVASTFSARVAGASGIVRLDAIECWIYQHGLRHMGEIEHARALVGLRGMTS